MTEKKGLEVVEYEGNKYVESFLAGYKEEQILSFQKKAAIFDEELTLKT